MSLGFGAFVARSLSSCKFLGLLAPMAGQDPAYTANFTSYNSAAAFETRVALGSWG